LLQSYPALRDDMDCDVLIVGAGISGALIADALSGAGMRVCVIDRREAGWGSTAASTALLQYEIDTEMQDLAELVGIDDAVLAYRACERAVRRLGVLARGMRSIDFRRMQSLYFASRSRDEKRVRSEASCGADTVSPCRHSNPTPSARSTVSTRQSRCLRQWRLKPILTNSRTHCWRG